MAFMYQDHNKRGGGGGQAEYIRSNMKLKAAILFNYV